MDRLNMSLDDLIEKNHQEKKGKNGGGKKFEKKNNNRPNSAKFGAVRKQVDFSRDDRKSEPYIRREVEVKQPLTYRPVKILGNIASNNNGTAPVSSSVFARLGKPPSASGTCVIFSNLKRTVDGSDLQELCSAVGELKEVEKADGSAKVWFARRSDAVTCVAKFNGLTLDGLVMSVTLADEPPAESVRPKSVFDRLKAPGPKNVKEGMFGTAIDDEDDDEPVSRRGGGGPVFQVTLGSGGGGGNRSFANHAHRQVEHQQERKSRPNNGGRGGGGGGRRQGGGNRSERGPKKEVNLDDDLDAYMATR